MGNSRYGVVVFESSDYKNDWNGQYKGQLLPIATYYFVVELGGTGRVYKGPVTLLAEKK
jgi:gliding motility-associated-like protein